MNSPLRKYRRTAMGLLLLSALGACVVGGGGYDGGVYVGGVYESPGFVYGGWGPGYRVGPPRGGGGARGGGEVARGGGGGGGARAAPSIPTRSRGR
jgi:hypothetical protein